MLMRMGKLTGLRGLVPLAAGLLLIAGSITAVLASAPAPASARATVTIHLTNSTSFCADVKNSVDVAGQPIWLFKCASANDYHWVQQSVPTCGVGTCWSFKDAQNTSLCLGEAAGGSSVNAVLVGCGATRSVWYIGCGAHKLCNLSTGAASALTVRGPLANRNQIFTFSSRGCTSCWQAWSGY